MTPASQALRELEEIGNVNTDDPIRDVAEHRHRARTYLEEHPREEVDRG